MKENKFKKLIDFIGLNYKKELLKTALIFAACLMVGITLTIILKNMFFSAIFLIIAVFSLYIQYFFYSSKKENILKERDEEFVTIINYFQTFVTNKNNVYNSFKKTLEYCSEWMRNELGIFLRNIDDDKSVKPYIDFSENFRIKIAKNIMLSIYQMVDEGEDERHLIQFESLFEQLSNKFIEEEKTNKSKSLSSITIFPLIGSVLITIILSISIIGIVEDIVNVL